MEVALLVISILLIIIVLLQSGKAESAGQIVQGGNSDLFANRKERGLELFISRLTMLLGIAYFALALFISLKDNSKKFFILYYSYEVSIFCIQYLILYDY